MISFVIPAHNEIDYLALTIDSIRGVEGVLDRESEIVVADDSSTDGTGELAESLGARVVRCEKRQIAGTRNAGAAIARGDYLIFVDADTTVNPEVVKAAVRALDEGAIGGGAGIDWDKPVGIQWRVFVGVLMTMFRITKFAAGSFLFCRRDVFEKVGGFDETLYAAEEIWLSQALKKEGRFVILKESVKTSARKLEDHSDWYVFKSLFWTAIRGPWGVRKRKGLELWYDQRS